MTSWAAYKAFVSHAEKFNRRPEDVASVSQVEPIKVIHKGPGTHGAGGGGSGGGHVDGPDQEQNGLEPAESSDSSQRPSGPDDVWTDREMEEMELLLQETRGHLGRSNASLCLDRCETYASVLYSTRFLEAEDLANNFLFNVRVALALGHPFANRRSQTRFCHSRSTTEAEGSIHHSSASGDPEGDGH